MDEEIDEERKYFLDKYTAGFFRSKQATCSLDLPRRVKREVTSRYAIREEAEAIKDEKRGGTAPFLREKPMTTPITQDMKLTLSCVAAGEPQPVIQWIRNDIILGEATRLTITNEGTRSTLMINGCCEMDLGLYKVVARNNVGQVFHKFRLVRGEIPGMCEPPEIEETSATQVLLKWRPPMDDGGAPIECYNLQKKEKGELQWTTISDNIPQEAILVEDLNPNSLYLFRIAAKNLRGWGEFSVSTPPAKTEAKGKPKLQMPLEQQLQKKDPKLYVLQLPGARGEIRDLLDYGREEQHVLMKSGDAAMLQIRKYKMVSELFRGKYSLVMRSVRQDDHRTFACKILQRKGRDEEVQMEFNMMKSLRHERLATLYEAYNLPDITCFILEYLGGLDILTFLASKLEYSEEMVSLVINQVLDGVAYLRWRGLCHLDIQPDNIVVISTKRVDVKLVDFGNTRKVERSGTQVSIDSLVDYVAPEILQDHTAYSTSDIWSVGVLAYVLLTGVSPFLGIDDEETVSNILFVRFKFENLGSIVSQEATRFIMLLFKRDPSKRPTEEECREHKWLVENEFTAKKKERSILSTGRLREYSMAYHQRRANQVSSAPELNQFRLEATK